MSHPVSTTTTSPDTNTESQSEKWLAAIGYILIAYDGFLTQVAGLYHLVLVGYLINYFTLVPFLFFYFISTKSKNDMIKGHGKKSMKIYRWYIVGAIISGILFRAPELMIHMGVYNVSYGMLGVLAALVIASIMGINNIANHRKISQSSANQ